jgi:hypothetical protein
MTTDFNYLIEKSLGLHKGISSRLVPHVTMQRFHGDALSSLMMFKQTQDKFRAELLAAYRGYVSHKNLVLFRVSSRETFEKYYRKAYSLGTSSHIRYTLGQQDNQWIKKAVNTETAYWNKFLSQMSGGVTRHKPEDRIEFYVETLEAVYHAGKVAALPFRMLISWEVQVEAEHCKSCLLLEKSGPYTKTTLPTTPRAGDTQCRNNCACRLVYRKATIREYTLVCKKINRTALLKRVKLAR